MNTSTMRVLAVFGLIATLVPVGAMAQEPTRFAIPFNFTVGHNSLVAGDYIVREMSPRVLQIQSNDGRANVLVMAASVEPGKIQGKVVMTFQKYGDQYFLSTVKSPDRGLEVPRSVREKELIAERASAKRFELIASSRK
jgi:hypothetical protein